MMMSSCSAVSFTEGEARANELGAKFWETNCLDGGMPKQLLTIISEMTPSVIAKREQVIDILCTPCCLVTSVLQLLSLRRSRLRAFLLGAHPRLGGNSFILSVPLDVIWMVAKYAIELEQDQRALNE